MYNYYQSQQQMGMRQQIPLKGRPVSSLEEVKAAPIDFDGSIFFFPDLANKRIYTKQINMDGTSSLFMYELKEIPITDSKSFITREELEQAMSQLKASLMPKPQEEKKYEF